MPRRNKDRVFRTFKPPKLLRKEIPAGEAGVGALILATLLGAGVWVATRGDAYDPSERDIAVELLIQDSVEDTLYRRPVERWRDPAQAAPDGAPTAQLGPFPAAVLGDWQVAGRLQEFTPDTLFEKIDGQAEQYLRFGCRGMAFLPLAAPGGEPAVDLFLYDQGSFAGALGVFGEQRGEKPVEQEGPVWFFPTAVGAVGMVGHRFFHVIGDRSDDAVTAKTREVLRALAPLADDAEEPAPFRLLTAGLGLPFGQVGYQHQDAFQYDFADGFWFGQLTADAPARVFVHQAADADAAARLAAELIAALGEDLEPTGEGEFRHPYLKTFTAVRHRDALVLGVEDAATPEAAAAAVERLVGALDGSTEEGN